MVEMANTDLMSVFVALPIIASGRGLVYNEHRENLLPAGLPVFPRQFFAGAKAMKKVISDVEEKLRTKDYKLTSRRENILQVLIENKDKHLSAEEIYYLVKKRAPDVGLATVYRTLELFSDFEIIHSIDFGDGRKRYELVQAEEEGHRHHHLICLRCGEIQEVTEDLLEDLERKVTQTYGFSITDHQLKIFGYCRSCREKK